MSDHPPEDSDVPVKVAGSTDVGTYISQNSRTTIGAAIAVAGVVLSACLWLNATLQGITFSVERLSDRLDRMAEWEKRLTVVERDGSQNWQKWVPLFRALNPALVIPNPDGSR